MGGLWEAGVKSFKQHFKKVAHPFKFTFEEFSTLLAKIEACLNSRPLSPMSEVPADFTALTAGHFLIGGPLLAPTILKFRSTSSIDQPLAKFKGTPTTILRSVEERVPTRAAYTQKIEDSVQESPSGHDGSCERRQLATD